MQKSKKVKAVISENINEYKSTLVWNMVDEHHDTNFYTDICMLSVINTLTELKNISYSVIKPTELKEISIENQIFYKNKVSAQINYLLEVKKLISDADKQIFEAITELRKYVNTI